MVEEYANANGDAKADAGRSDPSKWEAAFNRLEPQLRSQLRDIFDSKVVRPEDIDERALLQLSDFSTSVACDILKEFTRLEPEQIRNKSAYLSRMMARASKEGMSSVRLHPAVQREFDRLVDSGQLSYKEVDAKCFEALNNIPPEVAVHALYQFNVREPVRNMSAFFMSHLKKFPRDMPLPPVSHGSSRPAPAPVHAPPRRAAARTNYASEQGALGVRVQEFHSLSPHALYVHPSAAMKLQMLWDGGHPLVSLLDDASWMALSELPPPDALLVVYESANELSANASARTANTVFLDAAHRILGMMGPFHPIVSEPPARPPHHRVHEGREGRDKRESREMREGREATRGHDGAKFSSLPESVRMRIKDVLAMNADVLSLEHFDSGVLDALGSMNERDAIGVVDELASNDLSSVRCIPAYIMGICKNTKRVRRH